MGLVSERPPLPPGATNEEMQADLDRIRRNNSLRGWLIFALAGFGGASIGAILLLTLLRWISLIPPGHI